MALDLDCAPKHSGAGWEPNLEAESVSCNSKWHLKGDDMFRTFLEFHYFQHRMDYGKDVPNTGEQAPFISFYFDKTGW